MKRILLFFSILILSFPSYCQWTVEKLLDEFTEAESINFKLQAEKDPSSFLVIRVIPGIADGMVRLFSELSIESANEFGLNDVDVAIKLDSEPAVYETWKVYGGGTRIYSVPIYSEPYRNNRQAVFSPIHMYQPVVNITPLLKAKTLEIKVDTKIKVLKFKFNLAGLKEEIEKNPGFFELPNIPED